MVRKIVLDRVERVEEVVGDSTLNSQWRLGRCLERRIIIGSLAATLFILLKFRSAFLSFV